MVKIIIVRSMNTTPEEEVNERILPFIKQGFRVVTATSTLALHGNLERAQEHRSLFLDVARHVYYVTTVVLEK